MSTKMKVEDAIRAGLAVQELAAKYAKSNDFEARLPAGVVAGLASDVDELRGKANVSGQAIADRKSATAGVNQTSALAARLVSATRESIRRTCPGDKKVQKLFGVGQKLQTQKVASVATALQTLVDAAKVDPASARAAGLLPADTERMAKALSELVGADKVQEGKKVTAKQSTAVRRAAQERVERAIGLITGVAAVAFVDKPDVADAFRAAAARPGGKARNAPKPKPA